MSYGPRLSRLGLTLAEWCERWFPDPLVFALLGVVFVFLGGVLAGESPRTLALEAGKNVWTLVPFTMQMVMVIIGGYTVATAPLVARLIARIAAIPRSPRAAIALVALFSMLTSLISWGLSLVFSAFLVRELARRLRGLDYRAAGAAGYLGLGTVWALGLSSSSALLMATRGSLPPQLLAISGVIPLTQTIFLWQSLVMTALLITASVLVAYLSAPGEGDARTIEAFGIADTREEPVASPRPGEWLERSPLLILAIVGLLAVYLADVFRTSPRGALAALDLNTYNLIFLALGLLLQWSPRRFLGAVHESIAGASGVIIQFPIYAMIFGMISGTGLSEKLAGAFVSLSTRDTYPLLAAAYSATLGIFIPSGGSKWIIEAPYVLQAAIEHKIHLGWMVQIYNAAEALPNLINPFYMLPLLGILKLRARDIVGYGMLQLIVQAPLVFLLCWLFARTLDFVPPAP